MSARNWGADLALAPEEAEEAIEAATGGRGVDIAIEASGTAAALQSAIKLTGQEGTIAVLSFFGSRVVPLILAPEFHYRRQRIVSSQVGAVGGEIQARWTYRRRDEAAFHLLRQDWLHTPEACRLPFTESPQAYDLLDSRPDQFMAVILDYDRQRPGITPSEAAGP
jgi:threonine dehydrogenase-like Zn-dependent dehydrogenase